MTRMLAFLATAVLLAGAGMAADPPAKDLTLRPPAAATQGPVTFSHQAHKDRACADCHHKLAERPKDLSCAGCHDDLKSKTGEKSYYLAYHDAKSPRSCVGCHKAVKAGPTACNKCHAKR